MKKIIGSFPLKAFQLGISLLLLFLLLIFVHPLELFSKISQYAPSMIGIFVVGFLIMLLLNALTSWILVNGFSSIPLGRGIRYYVYSWSTEFFLPGKMGMFSIAYFWKKEGIPPGKSMAVILLHKLFMLFSLLLASGIGLFYWSWQESYSYLIGVALVGAILLIGLFFTKGGRDILKKYVLGKYSIHFAGFSETINVLLKQPHRIAALGGAMILIVIVNGFMLVWAFQQAGIDVPLIYVISAASTAMLAGLIPLSINGLGVKEGTFTVLMTLIQIPASITLAISTLSTLIGYGLGFFVSTLLVKEIPSSALEKWLAENKSG